MTDLLFSVRSDLYRACAVVASKEEVRYYLQGVYIEPHPVEGVTLVATDGHRMVVAHDIAGSCLVPVNVQITGDALRAGKPKRTDGPDGRRFQALSEHKITVPATLSEPGRAFECDWKIDHSYPEWRRVLPKAVAKPEGYPAFDPAYIGDFAKVAAELLINKPSILIQPRGEHGPALVTFSNSDVFGVLMPIKTDAGLGFPYFMSPKYRAEKAA